MYGFISFRFLLIIVYILYKKVSLILVFGRSGIIFMCVVCEKIFLSVLLIWVSTYIKNISQIQKK